MKKDDLLFILSLFIFGVSLFFLIDGFGTLKNKIVTGNSALGFVNLTIERVALVNFTIDNVDWGTGSVYYNASYATLTTLGEVIGGNWDSVGTGFIIENIGNANLSLGFSSYKNATDFIGGENPTYEYMVSDVDEGACLSPAGFDKNNFYEFPPAGTITTICDKFLSGQSIRFDLFLRIPYNSKVGNLSDIISVSIEGVE